MTSLDPYRRYPGHPAPAVHGDITRLPKRFWAKVKVSSDGCWLWTASIRPDGYGQVNVDGRMSKTHRVAYQAFRGPVPDGLHLDHLCRVRACCNPDHLEPVTPLVNALRGDDHHANKTHCPHGHPYTGDNLVVRRRTGGGLRRECLACIRAGKLKLLSHPMRDLLWTVAQHKYGWTYLGRGRGPRAVADALVRRGLVEWSARYPRDSRQPAVVATQAGFDVIERLWPVSPFALGTYAHQPGGWTPLEGIAA